MNQPAVTTANQNDGLTPTGHPHLKLAECSEPRTPVGSVEPEYLYADQARLDYEAAIANVDDLLTELQSLPDEDMQACAIVLAQLGVPDYYEFIKQPVPVAAVSASERKFHPLVVLFLCNVVPGTITRDPNEITERRKQLVSLFVHEAMHYVDGDLSLYFPYLEKYFDKPSFIKQLCRLGNILFDIIHDRALSGRIKGTTQAYMSAAMLQTHADKLQEGLAKSMHKHFKLTDAQVNSLMVRLNYDTMTKHQALTEAATWLQEEEPEDNGEGDDGGAGQHLELPQPGNPDGSRAEQLQDIQEQISNAESEIDGNNHKAGQMAGDQSSMFDLSKRVVATEQPVPWHEVLREHCQTTQTAGLRSTFRKYREEEALRGIYLPIKEQPDMKAVALLDVSGSMVWSGDEFGKIMFALSTAVSQAGCNQLPIVPFDTVTHGTLVITQENANDLEYGFEGGGGTSLTSPLKELIQRVQDQEIEPLDGTGTLIIGTDGYLASPNPEMIRRVNPGALVWLMSEEHNEGFVEDVTDTGFAGVCGCNSVAITVK